ncbi:hypothetical protein O4H49_04130 [Kiloniella laminariae]|uniref:Uncharacterized protein n=1 Tax=Kiloniella laminariae TaxID=454162 RepID=A0ABT4LFR9_9PROT|nr:hypothetical protein [Kiloniella laminariae]MCZ4279953.1 hypothetical protein [Kiloniella laminariae]
MTETQVSKNIPRDPVDLAIQQLKKAAFIEHPGMIAEACVKLYGFRGDAVSPLLQELRKVDLTRLEHKNIISLISSISTILHDLDEASSRAFITEALQQECHPSIRRTLGIVARFSLDNYRTITLGQIQIFEDKTIDPEQQASAKVESWLHNISAEDRSRISRIFILPGREDYDYASFHLAWFNVITLRWDRYARPDNRFLQLVFGRGLNFLREISLYQEVAHCVFGHRDHDRDEEKQAKIYTAKITKTLYPRLSFVLKTVNRINPIF